MKQFLIAFSARSTRQVHRHIRNVFSEWCQIMSSDRGDNSYLNWFHGSCSVYSVCSDGTADNIRNSILSLFDRDEREYIRIAVTETTGISGWLERHTWDWLDNAHASVELANIDNPTLVQILEHGGFSRELQKCYTVADIDRLLENYREYPGNDIANCRARMIASLQVRLRLLNTI